MPFRVVVGDIHEQNTQAVVIPLVPFSGPSSKFGCTTYDLAGREELLKARRALPKLSDGECAITGGFGLSAQYVIHARVPEWFGDLQSVQKPLSKCYCNALRIAAKNGITSISFPLLGGETNRVPRRTSFIIARDALDGYIKAHELAMTVYLVILPSVSEEVADLEDCVSVKPKGVLGKLPDTDILPMDRFYGYIRRIERPSKIADLMGCSPSTVTRICNHECKSVPQKSTVIQMAVALGLTKEERLEFVNCVHPPYPYNEQDEAIERLLEQGCESVIKLDIELEKINPQWVLARKTKGEAIHQNNKT